MDLAVECLAGHLENRLIRQDRQIGAGHLRDQRELRAAPCLLVPEILLQRGAIQAADLAEQIELIGGKSNARPDRTGWSGRRAVGPAARAC